LGFLYLFYRKTPSFQPHPTSLHAAAADGGIDPFLAVKDIRLLRMSLVVFAFTVTLLVLHQALDLVVAFVALLGATLILILGGRDMPDLVAKVDWHTLVFLGGLFVIVGGLDHAGVLDEVARTLGGLAGGNLPALLLLLMWASAGLSMVLDNVPFAAAMVPVIRDLSAQGIPLGPMTWTLALGTDLGGNATPIGASANVVGLAIAEKHHIRVSWREYLRPAVPATFLALAVATLFLLLRFT
jgi:Na+/H+ antiporter NhaD/arsenite permease-like protein